MHAWLLLFLRAVPAHDVLLFVPMVGAAAWLVGASEARRTWALTALLAAVLGSALLHLWQTGFVGRNHVFAAGFPISDAGEYYWDAARVLHGLKMASTGSRRPLLAAVLGGVMVLGGGSMKLAHVATLLFWAAGGAFATSAVWRTHGARMGVPLFVLFAMFARRYVGLVHSEGLGAPLGAFAFGLLWRVRLLERQWEHTFYGAVFLQALSLLARPGPFFVLLGLLVYGCARASSGRRIRILLPGVLAIAIAWTIQYVVRKVATTETSYWDLPCILYGLVHGEDGLFVFRQHPELKALSLSAGAARIWGLLWSDLLAQPSLVVRAPAACLASWFYLPQGFFGFVWWTPDDWVLEDRATVQSAIRDHGMAGPLLLWTRTLGVQSLVNTVALGALSIAFVVGVLRGIFAPVWRALRWRWRRGPAPGPLPPFAAMLVGILVSLPLLPPWITEGVQILATVFFPVATFALLSLLPAQAEANAQATAATPAPGVAPAIAAGVLALIAIPHLRPARPPVDPCGTDPMVYLADVDWTSARTFGAPQGARNERDVRENLRVLERNTPELARNLRALPAGEHRIVPVYDACHERVAYVIYPVTSSTTRWTTLRTRPLGSWPFEVGVP